MVATYAITVALIFLLLTAWILVKQLGPPVRPALSGVRALSRKRRPAAAARAGSDGEQGQCGGHSCSAKRG
ncbi:MAG: hypothetical protein MZV65_48650 [Chromatiales bacterium]|nr:hypothetical protein [Chromatiales bacterium]